MCELCKPYEVDENTLDFDKPRLVADHKHLESAIIMGACIVALIFLVGLAAALAS